MTNNTKGILLESGTNEFEIVEFSVGPVTYGINVAKVREVINPVAVTKMPNTHPHVEGVFTLRGKVMPLVNLAKSLGCDQISATHKIIVSELNNYFVGFLVDEVYRIHRISWTEMEPPPNISNSDMVVEIVKMTDKMVVLLDFERIVADINPEINRKLTTVPKVSENITQGRKYKSILIAEDSKMLRDLLLNTLRSANYENVTLAENGAKAWETLEALAKGTGAVEDTFQLIITDIEMQQMDGHHLLKRIKENDRLKVVPVIKLSKIINDEMRRKGDLLGASAQVTKPEIGQLIELIDKFIL